MAPALRPLILVAFVLAASSATRPDADAQQVVAAEYYIDADPGPGNGTAVAVGTPGDRVELQVDVPPAVIAALAPGTHLLVCRMQDDQGEWAHAFARSFYRHDPVPPQPAPELVAAEFFIDEDPGVGNGVLVPFTPGLAVGSLTVDVPPALVAELAAGPHLLGCRARDAEGNWSAAHARLFYKRDPAPGVDPGLDRIEYQWARDGSLVGAPIPVFPESPTDATSLEVLASLAGLSDGGVYRLVVTPYDTAGNRGISVTSEEVLVQTTDSDGDGVPDLWEVTFGFHPNDPSDMQLGSDADGDGLDNRREFTAGTNPRNQDTDGDSVPDQAELGLSPLGFDPLVPSGDLLEALYGSAEGAGLYRREQLQALALGKPLVGRDADTGALTLRFSLSKSTDLETFASFPFTDAGTTVTPLGDLEFEFVPEDDAAFFSLEVE